MESGWNCGQKGLEANGSRSPCHQIAVIKSRSEGQRDSAAVAVEALPNTITQKHFSAKNKKKKCLLDQKERETVRHTNREREGYMQIHDQGRTSIRPRKRPMYKCTMYNVQEKDM